jgi:hypothetical protein
MIREGIMAEWHRERIYMPYDFNYPHDSFSKVVDAAPIFKYPNDGTLLFEVEVFRNVWGELPGSVSFHFFKPVFETRKG